MTTPKERPGASDATAKVARRSWLGWMVGAAVASGASTAAAEPRKKVVVTGPPTLPEYLARAALLLDENRRAIDWTFGHPGDYGLAELAGQLAERRSTVAAEIVAPPVARQAHMHLLLVLENSTAAFNAASIGDDKRAAQHVSSARVEEQTLGLALEAAKLRLPNLR